MKQIPLRGKYGEGKFALVDDEDYEELSKRKWYCDKKGYAYRKGYRKDGRIDNGYVTNKCYSKKPAIFMHRVIMNAPEDVLIDHEDRNKHNNQKYNLRFCTNTQNIRNGGMRKNNKSGYKGVCFSYKLNKWRSTIMVDRKSIHLGLFPTPIEAARTYNEAAIKYFGDFARLNEIGTNGK